jgi:hypothetical protein
LPVGRSLHVGELSDGLRPSELRNLGILIELVGRFSGFNHAEFKQIEKSLPATKALVDLLNRGRDQSKF